MSIHRLLIAGALMLALLVLPATGTAADAHGKYAVLGVGS